MVKIRKETYIKMSNNYVSDMEINEMIDIVDYDGSVVGTAEKGVAHRLGLWHKAFHCWIIQEKSDKQYILYQKRGRSKLLCPNMFDISVAGHYKSSEGIEGGQREIKEEIGIDVSYDDLIYLGKKYDIYKANDISNFEICDIVLLKLKESIENLQPSYPELEGIAMVELNDGLMLFNNKVDMISATAIIWNDTCKNWNNCTIELTRELFCLRADNYFFKILTTINSYLKGYLNLNF